MKKFLAIIALVSITTLCFAQAVPTLINRNYSETFQKKVKTTNATATRIDLVPVADNEVGHIVVKIVGYSADSVAAITGTRTYRYSKVGGTLTIGSAIETVAIVADTKVSGATFAVTALDNNLETKVTGKAAVVMYWTAVIKQFAYKTEE